MQQLLPSLKTMEKKTSSSIEFENLKDTELRLGLPGAANEPARAQKRALVVGWPPVRNFRKLARKSEPESSGMFVKVSMDGAAYLRKLDLKMYKGYKEMKEALENLFKSVSVEYVIVYVDKDGDWMLVGDVPWSMFVQSCTKLRIMKASEAGGFNLSSYNAS